jgi:TfuA protein
MNAVVFLGPSLDRADAERELDAEYLPPVRRGDIDALLTRPRRPDTIGIVDGRFLHSMAISPKEVLRAIDAGISVYGSSSMGALRAVECAPYGMVGVGKVYDEYASGRVDADDEVAIAYDEETGRAMSEPLVNWRIALAAGVAAGAVPEPLARRFLALGEATYFPQRTRAGVLRLLAAEVGEPECVGLAAYLADPATDAKRTDALALLRRIREAADPVPPPVPAGPAIPADPS